jgi:hypothetical protein
MIDLKKMIMKKLIVVALLAISLPSISQSIIGGDNIIKTNLSSDLLKNYNITYERSINHFMSWSASFRSMPLTSLPLKGIAKKFIDNPNIDFDNFKIGNTALTLEGRFYLGLQKMSGFYVAPYARFANFKVSVPVQYAYTPVVQGITLPTVTTKASMDGNIRSTAVGAYVGFQYQLLTKLVLDLWIAGGSYGSANGNLNFDAPAGTPTIAMTALKNSLDQTNIHPFNMSTKVKESGTGVTTDMNGPWAGFRGIGLTVGLRF